MDRRAFLVGAFALALSPVAKAATVARRYWTKPVQFFANPKTGNDANDGLSHAKPFKTLMGGYRAIRRLHDFGGYNPCLYLSAGQYNTPLVTEGPLVGAEFLSVIGDLETPGNVVIQADSDQACFSARDTAILILQGLKLATRGGRSKGIDCSQFAVVDFDHLEFGEFPGGTHIAAYTMGSVNCTGVYSITGSAACHADISDGSQFSHGRATVTIGAGLEFEDAGGNINPLLSVRDYAIYNGGAVFAGPGAGSNTIGKKYNVANAVARMNGTAWPGNVPGTP